MDGFGVHTYRLINGQGKSTFVKFHWKPLLGVHSLVWDEAQQLAGKNLDFNRRDLWEAIVNTVYPEYELALQLVPEAEAEKAPFDILDATKIWPEDQFPLQRVGKLTLNRNPDNFFSETEEVAFHPGHLVPGQPRALCRGTGSFTSRRPRRGCRLRCDRAAREPSPRSSSGTVQHSRAHGARWGGNFTWTV